MSIFHHLLGMGKLGGAGAAAPQKGWAFESAEILMVEAGQRRYSPADGLVASTNKGWALESLQCKVEPAGRRRKT